MGSTGPRPKFRTHKSGWNLPLTRDFQNFDKLLQYEPDEGDIIIMTYPKCGTTWTQYIVYLLMNNCQPLAEGQSLYDFIPVLEKGIDALSTLPRPRAMKVHLSFRMMKYNEKAKYICVVRNPKDCCVSFYHHVKGMKDLFRSEDSSFDEFFESFMEGQVVSNDYFDHLLSLYAHRKKPNVLFLVYEDMKADHVGGVRKIADFISDLLPNVNFCDEYVAKVAKESTFNRMKERNIASLVSIRDPGSTPFLRKGIIGDWLNYFSEEQNQRLEGKFAEKLLGTGAEHLWRKCGIHINKNLWRK